MNEIAFGELATCRAAVLNQVQNDVKK